MSRSGADRPCLLVFERGLSIPIPDLRRMPGLLFPVLGDYCLLDFLLASLAPLEPRIIIALEENARELMAPAIIGSGAEAVGGMAMGSIALSSAASSCAR